MIIDKVFLETQKKSIETQMKQLEADYHAARGALKMIEYSLTHLEKQVEDKVNG
jgi:hypothetical protein